jgi:hypothetical protein
VGAVSDEVERQLEKRAVEFVDSALAGVFGQIADAVSDPDQATEAAELRMAFFDGALELTGPQLAREIANLDVAGGAEILRAGLKRWLATPAADKDLTEFVEPLLSRIAEQPLKEALAEVGLLEVTRAVAQEQLAVRIRAITATPAFAAWLTSLQ